MTSGRHFTWKAERKSASRTARAATCWAMRRNAPSVAAETACRSDALRRERLMGAARWGRFRSGDAAYTSAVRIRLRYPASPENARDHAQIAVDLAREEYDAELDFSPGSLELVDSFIESLREEGLDGEGAAERLFVFGCYLGEVMVRHLGGSWVPTARSPLRGVSPWPMVVALDRRLGLGRDREGVQAARARGQRVPARVLRDGEGRRAVIPGTSPGDDEPPSTTRGRDPAHRGPRPAPLPARARSRRWSRSTCVRAASAASCGCASRTGAGKGVQRAAVRRVLGVDARGRLVRRRAARPPAAGERRWWSFGRSTPQAFSERARAPPLARLVAVRPPRTRVVGGRAKP